MSMIVCSPGNRGCAEPTPAGRGTPPTVCSARCRTSSTIPAPLRPEPISDDRYRITNTGERRPARRRVRRAVPRPGDRDASATRHPGKDGALDPGDLRPSRTHRRAHRALGRPDPRWAHVRQRHRHRRGRATACARASWCSSTPTSPMSCATTSPMPTRHRAGGHAAHRPGPAGLSRYRAPHRRRCRPVVGRRARRPGGDVPLGPVTGAPRRTVGPPGGARVGDRRLPDRHRAATARGRSARTTPIAASPPVSSATPSCSTSRSVPTSGCCSRTTARTRVAVARSAPPTCSPKTAGFVASYVQTNMVRFFADPALADGTQYRTVM